MEAPAIFPLGAGCADAGRRIPEPPDAAVGGLYKSNLHSTLHLPTFKLVHLLTLLREASGDEFKGRLRLDPNKAIHRGEEGIEVLTLD